MSTITISLGATPGLSFPGAVNASVPQLSNIFDGLRRIPAFFRRIDPDIPTSPGSMLSRFIIASAPDTHTQWDYLIRFKTFVNLIKDDTRFSVIAPERMVNAVMVQGDVTTEQTTKAESLAVFAEFTDMIADYGVDLLACFGNHDSNSSASNTTAIVLSKAEQRAALIDPIIANVTGIVSDVLNANACYYYKDYEEAGAYKVRVIVLDDYDMPQDITGDSYTYTIYNGRNYSQAQLTWLAEVALAVDDADHHVMIFSHESLVVSATHNTSHTARNNLIDAFAKQGTVIMNDATADFAFTLNVDFSVINGFNGHFIGYFYGHGHVPLNDTVTINGTEYNDTEIIASGAGALGYNKQPDTGVEDAGTFIITDTGDMRLFLLRYGTPCDKDGDGLPFGDYGIDSLIHYFCPIYQEVYNILATKPSNAVAFAQNKLVCGLIDDGVWDKLDVFHLFAQTSDGGSDALRNWIDPGTYDGVLFNTPVFSTLEGYTSNGTNARINSPYNPTTHATNYAQNSATVGCYIRTNTAETKSDLGVIGGANKNVNLITRNAGDQMEFRINDNQPLGVASTDSRGMWIATRTGANTRTVYRNKAVFWTDVAASVGVPDSTFQFLALSTQDGYTTRQQSAAFIGGGFTQADVDNMTDRIEAYMDSNGRGVIT